MSGLLVALFVPWLSSVLAVPGICRFLRVTLRNQHCNLRMLTRDNHPTLVVQLSIPPLRRNWQWLLCPEHRALATRLRDCDESQQ